MPRGENEPGSINPCAKLTVSIVLCKDGDGRGVGRLVEDECSLVKGRGSQIDSIKLQMNRKWIQSQIESRFNYKSRVHTSMKDGRG